MDGQEARRWGRTYLHAACAYALLKLLGPIVAVCVRHALTWPKRDP